MLHPIEAGRLPLDESHGGERPAGEDVSGVGLVAQDELLLGDVEAELVLADDGSRADRVDAGLLELGPGALHGFCDEAGGAARGVALGAVVALDEIDVGVRVKELRSIAGKLVEYSHAEAEVRGVEYGNLFGGLA